MALKALLTDSQQSLEGEVQRVAWIKPLRRIPEKEVRLYAIGRDLGFADADEKPYADALRSVAKGLLCGFDCRHPGTNYSLLRGLEKVRRTKGPARAKPLSKECKIIEPSASVAQLVMKKGQGYANYG